MTALLSAAAWCTWQQSVRSGKGEIALLTVLNVDGAKSKIDPINEQAIEVEQRHCATYFRMQPAFAPFVMWQKRSAHTSPVAQERQLGAISCIAKPWSLLLFGHASSIPQLGTDCAICGEPETVKHSS